MTARRTSRAPRSAASRVAAVAVLLLATAFAAQAEDESATPETHPAQAAVREALAEARRTVEGPGDRPAKLEQLGDISRALFDTESMATRALGSHLEGRTPEQRTEFMALFDEYIVRAYLQKLLFFRNPRFAFAKPRAEGDSVWVRTRIVTRRDDYFVDYRMEPTDAGWLASDVVVEHISLADNFAAQFTSLLERRTFDELLAKMRAKVDRHRKKLEEKKLEE